ncbi:cryptochrome/photolyase family protein [Streptococcus minor]|nr:deoxyribodipyrimidine photo-lyase [Streptococcus minor]
MVSVVWFRRDLRMTDHKALAKAIAARQPILCFFHLNEKQLSSSPTPNQSAFLASLMHFQEELKKKNIELHLVYGELLSSLEKLYCDLPDWTDVYFNYDESGFGRKRDQAAATFFREKGIAIHAYQDHYLHGSQEVLNQTGQSYKVFTPYYKSWIQLPKETPISIELSQATWLSMKTSSQVLHQIKHLWDGTSLHYPGTEQALAVLADFVSSSLAEYDKMRDFPAKNGTSRLSSYLRSGEISIRQVYHAVSQASTSQGQATFIKELAWRDFYNMIYVCHPEQKERSIQPAFDLVEWENRPADLEAWKKGQTGYPIIDAAMRQLSQTGWMHNRLRMIVASFLTKDLLIDWRLGEKHFQEMLIDYDAASNIGGWQWAASTGTDAVPYFRIFNPVTQSQRFDPQGDFIKTYLPELRSLPAKHIHQPWKLPKNLDEELDFELGRDYPKPIVDHSLQRKRAIAKYEWAKENYHSNKKS